MSKKIKSLCLFAFLAVGTMLVFAHSTSHANPVAYQCDASTTTECKIDGVGSGSGALKPATAIQD
jgi:hypothetical protein